LKLGITATILQTEEMFILRYLAAVYFPYCYQGDALKREEIEFLKPDQSILLVFFRKKMKLEYSFIFGGKMKHTV